MKRLENDKLISWALSICIGWHNLDTSKTLYWSFNTNFDSIPYYCFSQVLTWIFHYRNMFQIFANMYHLCFLGTNPCKWCSRRAFGLDLGELEFRPIGEGKGEEVLEVAFLLQGRSHFSNFWHPIEWVSIVRYQPQNLLGFALCW